MCFVLAAFSHQYHMGGAEDEDVAERATRAGRKKGSKRASASMSTPSDGGAGTGRRSEGGDGGGEQPDKGMASKARTKKGVKAKAKRTSSRSSGRKAKKVREGYCLSEEAERSGGMQIV